MISANIFDAKTNLSRYVSTVEKGIEPFIVIKRGNKPVAKLVPYDNIPIRKIGIAKDKMPSMGNVEDFNSIDCGMMEGGELL